MQIQFGNYILDTPFEKIDLEDLVHSKANKMSSDILDGVKDQIMADMREAIQNGDLQTAAKLNGYLCCIEDLVTLFVSHIPDSLKLELE